MPAQRQLAALGLFLLPCWYCHESRQQQAFVTSPHLIHQGASWSSLTVPQLAVPQARAIVKDNIASSSAVVMALAAALLGIGRWQGAVTHRARSLRCKVNLNATPSEEAKAKASEDEEDEEDSEDEEDEEEEGFEEDDLADFMGGSYEEDEYDEYQGAYSDDSELVAKGKHMNLQGSAQKMRRVLWQIKGRSYRDALILLEFMPWRACRPALKLLQRVASQAQNQLNMDKSRLYIKRCWAGKAPKMKRMRAVSKGQRHPYVKHHCHLWMELAEMKEAEEDFYD